jgi:hypothetical protein
MDALLLASHKEDKLARQMQTIMGLYVTIEQYFMAESVRKAVRIDAVDPDAQTSSVVDDVFYILQRSARRAISSSNGPAICAVLNHVSSLIDLGSELVSHLRRGLESYRPNAAATNIATILAATANASAPPPRQFLVALNNVEVAKEYLGKLRKDLERDLVEQFGSLASNRGPAEARMTALALENLGEATAGFGTILDQAMETLVTGLASRLQAAADHLLAVSYEMGDAEHAAHDVGEPFMARFRPAMDAFLEPFRAGLTPGNFDTFVHVSCRVLAQRFEALIIQRKVTQLGGLALDRDVRAILAYFSAQSQRTVRDRFVRVSQIVMLLSMDKLAEVMEYWGAGSSGVVWRLTASEVRKVLGLRIDFRSDQIAALRL